MESAVDTNEVASKSNVSPQKNQHYREDTLRETYRRVPEKELMWIKPSELTPVARKLWRDEVSRRNNH
ncbi:MAG: hypothetical protein Q7Q73_04325 [Verrucomicrobiota bacterium JB024]|nr:hypothetical protein [Verrucomicrobiota bacterium JB024]